MKSRKRAMITEVPTRDNFYSYRVITEDSDIMWLRGLGAPSPGHLFERGFVEYQTGSNFGLWFWEPEVKGS